MLQCKITQHNTLNVKLSNSQLDKLKSAIKNGSKVTLNLSSNVTGYCNDENNFPHKLLLTNRQVSKLCNAFANNSSANIKLNYNGSFGVEYPKEIKKFIGNKNILTNIFRIQAYESIMCGYFCIGYIDFLLQGKNLLEYINLFSPNDYENNDKTILRYFQ